MFAIPNVVLAGKFQFFEHFLTSDVRKQHHPSLDERERERDRENKIAMLNPIGDKFNIRKPVKAAWQLQV